MLPPKPFSYQVRTSTTGIFKLNSSANCLWKRGIAWCKLDPWKKMKSTISWSLSLEKSFAQAPPQYHKSWAQEHPCSNLKEFGVLMQIRREKRRKWVEEDPRSHRRKSKRSGGTSCFYARFSRLMHLVGPPAPNSKSTRAATPRDTCQGFSTPLAQTYMYSELKCIEWRVLDSSGVQIPLVFALTMVQGRFNSKLAFQKIFSHN